MVDSGQPATDKLNPREIEVLRLVAQGLLNKEIAVRLSLSVNGSKWYLKQIYEKLGVQNRIEALTRAREHGILADVPEGIAPSVQPVSNPYRGLKTFHRQMPLFSPDAKNWF